MAIGTTSIFLLIWNALKLIGWSFLDWLRRNIARQEKTKEIRNEAIDAIKRGNSKDFLNAMRKARAHK
jgi:hypothetical protein